MRGNGSDVDYIDVGRPKRRKWLLVLVIIIVALLLFGSRLIEIYVDSLWFASLGYEQIYWYKFRLGAVLFFAFLLTTFALLKLTFMLLRRVLPQLTAKPRVRLASIESLADINVAAYFYRPISWILSSVVGLLFAISMSGSWPRFALFLNAASSGETEPIFNRDVGFYLLKLPALDLVCGWLIAITVIILALTAAATGYISYYERLRGNLDSGTRARMVAANSVAAAPLAIALAVRVYLDRFDLLFGQHEIFSGITYTDANVRLPGLNALAAVLLLGALALVINAFLLRRTKLVVVVAGAVAAVWIFADFIVPQSIYSFSVRPNELAKESEYIGHNIEMTRKAFALDRFIERPFNPTPVLAAEQLQANREMLENIRLWDRTVLQRTLKQYQEIRSYYEFDVPDVDRYTVNGRRRQMILAAREMNVDQLPEASNNWINRHLVYTHGYGITMSTVNEFTPEGLPNLLLKNMPVESQVPEIKVTRPEIYFGEATTSHVYVHTRSQTSTLAEFNYPAPNNEDAYTQYEGDAGIRVGGFLRQIALALYLGDGSNLLFSDYINSDSKVLIRRAVLDRARQIAPFVLFEDDPYIVISREGRLYWMIDGFTYSDRYPLSRAYSMDDRRINYIRNSVKVVVDAYSGATDFYLFEPDDPIVKTYRNIFPNLFHPAEQMPEDLREHIRYPSQMVRLQARVFALYHMRNPPSFYNHEDAWAIPTAESQVEGREEPAPMEPYHALMALPGEKSSALEFVNILPFTPAGQGRNNMIGWLGARSDGEYYGSTTVYTFPKNTTIAGPAQIRARASQDPQLSQKMALWNTQGSRLLRGNLLAIPIADSLLYLEPFYIEAQRDGLPELRQVVIANQDRLAAGATFYDALNALFPGIARVESRAPTPESSRSPVQPSQEPSTSQPPPATTDVDELARQARQLLLDYERLTAEGKHREAGEKLDNLKRLLEQLVQKRGAGR